MRNKFWSKFRFTVLIITILQLGQQILIPQLDKDLMLNILQANPLLNMYTSVTGAQYMKPTLFSIGMGPYMITMIFFSALRAINVGKKWTSEGRDRLRRVIILILSILQATQMVNILKQNPAKNANLDSRVVLISAIIILVAGAMLVTWLANMNTAYGLGGMGIMIVPGMISSTIQLFSGANGGTKFFNNPVNIAIIILVTLIFITITEFFSHAELRIPIQHVMIDNKLTKSYLAIQVLVAGAMPIMFGRMVLRIPQLLTRYLENPTAISELLKWTSTNKLQGIFVYGVILVVLGHLFGYMMLTPHNTMEDMQKSGDYFWNVKPGPDTEKFLIKRMNRMIFIGNIYAVIICCSPLIIGLKYPAVSVFSTYFASLYMMVIILNNVIEQVKGLYAVSYYELI